MSIMVIVTMNIKIALRSLVQKSSNGLKRGSYNGIGGRGTGSYAGRTLESLSVHVLVEELCVGRITRRRKRIGGRGDCCDTTQQYIQTVQKPT